MTVPPPEPTPGGAGAPRRSPAAAVLDLLGLAARARALVAGTEQVRKAVREGKAQRVLLAADGAPSQQAKLTPLLDARKVKYHIGFSRDELGTAIGRNPVSAVGITDANFARRVGELLAALPSLQAKQGGS